MSDHRLLFPHAHAVMRERACACTEGSRYQTRQGECLAFAFANALAIDIIRRPAYNSELCPASLMRIFADALANANARRSLASSPGPHEEKRAWYPLRAHAQFHQVFSAGKTCS